MLSKRTHLGECKANEETSLYEHLNESIKVNAYLILMIRWDEKSSNELWCTNARTHLPWYMSWM